MLGVKGFIHKLIWKDQVDSVGPWKGRLLLFVQILHVMFQELFNGRMARHAMGLVYTTQLSLVPLLAVSFAILKEMGVHNQLKPVLLSFLEPLGPQSYTITNQIVVFVENARLGVLGLIGSLLLLYSVISLLNKVEVSFNLIWQVQQSRSFTRRFADFVSVLVIGSLLIIATISISTASLSSQWGQWLISIEPLGLFVQTVTRLLPVLLTLATFTFLYTFIPYTRVQLYSAFLGGLAATILLKTSGWVVTSFVINSPNLTAIYSTFVGLILFLIWLYVGWLIALVGASIAFYHQYPEYLTHLNYSLKLSNRMKEYLSLQAFYWIGQHHLQKKPAWTIPKLAKALTISPIHMTQVILTLKDAGWLHQSRHRPPQFTPSCPLETTSVHQVLKSVRTANESHFVGVSDLTLEPATRQIMKRLEQGAKQALQNLTMKDFILNNDPVTLAGQEVAGKEVTGG
ncbi:MAG: YihY/virulence factor BrkB family protein [Magnetococcales bacterium]|nr:YihY/virulence factor BrkB family protein [Magnetococcales bacterium]